MAEKAINWNLPEIKSLLWVWEKLITIREYDANALSQVERIFGNLISSSFTEKQNEMPEKLSFSVMQNETKRNINITCEKWDERWTNFSQRKMISFFHINN